MIVHRERKLPEDEADLVAVLFFNRLQLRIERATRRALVIAILFKRDLRVRAAAHMRSIRSGRELWKRCAGLRAGLRRGCGRRLSEGLLCLIG